MPGSSVHLKRTGAVVLVLLVLFSGCLAPGTPSTDPAEAQPDLLRFRYDCPPGDTITLANGLCVTTFGDPQETFEEPYLAVHPQRPEVMALGMNAWHADPRPVLRDGAPSLEIGRVAILATKDGGATWERMTSPPILYGTEDVGTTSYSGDPVLAFDARGALHYLQTSVAFDGLDPDAFPYIDIQYARSEDMGATWSQNVLLADDGDNDRPWLTIGDDGHLFATWRNNIGPDGPPELAWSTNGGATWHGPVAAPRECTNGDRAIVRAEGVLVPCEVHEDGVVTGLQVNRFDLQAQRSGPVGRIDLPDGWAPTDAHVVWDEAPDGVLGVATRQGDASGFVAFSRDGGATWSAPIALQGLCGCETGTGSLHVYGAAFDAWGGFHLLLADARVETPDQASEGNLRYATGQRAVFHVVIDTQGSTLHEQELTTSDPRLPPSAAPPIGRDDYFVPAFWSDGGAIAWTRDKGVDLTHVAVDRTAGERAGAAGTASA